MKSLFVAIGYFTKIIFKVLPLHASFSSYTSYALFPPFCYTFTLFCLEIQDKLRNCLKCIRENSIVWIFEVHCENSGHDVNMGKGEQKISLSSVSRGLVTQMSDTLIHKKQVQQKRYKKVYFTRSRYI